jgi:Leucine-rich repeat (LRR) protein
LRKLTDLEDLTLESNFGNGKFKKLPAWIGDFSKLRRLCLYHTELKELPETIGNLQNLKLLSLRGSAIETLPPAV